MNYSNICRYGWYIPERTAAGPSALLTHWRILQQKEKLSIFKPTHSQYQFVTKMAAKTKMRYGYRTLYCNFETTNIKQGPWEIVDNIKNLVANHHFSCTILSYFSAGCSKCFDGLFTPTWCQGSVSPTNGCALFLTTFPSNSEYL